MPTRRSLLLAAPVSSLVPWCSAAGEKAGAHEYEQIRWADERDDPSITIETPSLVAKIIDNTGLRTQQDRLMERAYSHYLGYHDLRCLYHKDERRNIVSPFFSILNFQSIRVEGLDMDPVDPRARYGAPRGWPMRISPSGNGASLKIDRLPVSGLEYELLLHPAGDDALDFDIKLTLHRKTQPRAGVYCSWACYMSTFNEVELHAPFGDVERPAWKAFGEAESLVLGDAVNYVHAQRRFDAPQNPAFPAIFGRIGKRVLVLMADRPQVEFFLVNTGGHMPYLPIQNPAWDFQVSFPDYEPGRPLGFRGRLIYKEWNDDQEIADRYRAWRASLRAAGEAKD